jgi:hypothetical protein
MHQRFFSGMLQTGLQEFDLQRVQTFAPVIPAQILKTLHNAAIKKCIPLQIHGQNAHKFVNTLLQFLTEVH